MKYFTKDILIEANNAAIREKRNRQLNKNFVKNLSSNKIFWVIKVYYHNKNEVRVTIAFDEIGTYKFLDISHLRYKTLPVAQMNNDGTVSLESKEVTELKKPYKGREWKEIIVKKPVRKQNKFRKSVLNAYGNQCAVCSINNSGLLRAAHILDVTKGGNDSINNGICMCVLHEIAFDKGILKINPDYTLHINNNENIKVEYNKLRLPDKIELYPSKEFLQKKIENLEKY